MLILYSHIIFHSPPQEAYDKGKEAIEKALKIDDGIAESHASLGLIKTLYDWDWAGAEKEFKIAVDLNPSCALAHFWYGCYFLWKGNNDIALEKMNHALKLEPLSLVINCDIGLAFYASRQYDRAFDQYHKTLEIDPHFSYAHLYLGWTYLQKSLYKDALIEFKKEVELSGGWDPNVVETWIGITYAKMRKKDKAQEMLDDLLNTSRQTFVSPYHLGLLYFALGENDLGFRMLEKAVEEKDFWLCWAIFEPMFDAIRNESRFKKIMKKIGHE